MKTKIDIKNIRGGVIFSFEKEDNTLKDTVEQAVKNGVNLHYANLRGTDLRDAGLRGANFEGSNLRGADLRRAILRDAVLKGADLRYTNLIGALLYGADLEGANLEGADIYGAILIGAKNVPNLPITCPSDGEFIAWKKICNYAEDYEGDFLVKLLIPKDAKRSSATTEKCRCDKAKVLDITNIKTGEHVDVITNAYRPVCTYRVGEMVYPDSFDNNRWLECSHGIHFFMEKEKAINY